MDRTLADVADARDGRLLEIAEVTGTGAAIRRIREIGFCTVAPVRFLRRAPLGDPAMYELRGALLSLRRSEAQRIRVHRAAP